MTKTKYVWNANIDSCAKCSNLDGAEYESIGEVPSPPHPNCKCSVTKLEKDYRANKKETKKLQESKRKEEDHELSQKEVEKLKPVIKKLEGHDLTTKQITQWNKIFEANKKETEEWQKLSKLYKDHEVIDKYTIDLEQISRELTEKIAELKKEREKIQAEMLENYQNLMNNPRLKNEKRDLIESISEKIDTLKTWLDVSTIFFDEYQTMKSFNGPNHDRHQHALANAQATSKYGKIGEQIAIKISDFREDNDLARAKGNAQRDYLRESGDLGYNSYPIARSNKQARETALRKYTSRAKQHKKDREHDEKYNKIGRELGFKYPNASRDFLSQKLYEEYGIDNRYYHKSYRERLLEFFK